ncbi:MAG: nuclear transport factor 2 family protein [Candidatus Bipolaricaulota bacterium]|nr:nuclear transport factor 2 family protein [Candidatus Bipolaricaulota bacterium]MCS7275256.1 nuclear transport factor 2 family protein [Candidatus Bipolaricaulota bacterium]MDW8111621.1 nuclear transport factor 2 family protein [Candidatus Bipolaricaulota bacterium]MDW8328535.1 nuclear transport factor 2 family protein [Candidatus Bipolaricaulota bacterium]
MRGTLFVLLLAAIGLIAGCTAERPASPVSSAPAHQEQDPEEQRKADERAIKAVLTLLSQGFARLDVSKLEDLWAPTATIIDDNISFSSWEQYRDQHLKPELALYSSEDSEWVIANAQMEIEGTLAWGQFHIFYAFTRLVDNQRIFGEGRGTIIFIKTSEGWKILHLHLS